MSLRSLILVADDDDLLQAVLEHKLTAVGYDVALADHGRAVLERVGLLRPALIILDAMMPIMDGYEVARHIREREQAKTGEHVPIIAMTAHALKGDRDKCISAGMDDYISKPFNPHQLQAVLIKNLIKIGA